MSETTDIIVAITAIIGAVSGVSALALSFLGVSIAKKQPYISDKLLKESEEEKEKQKTIKENKKLANDIIHVSEKLYEELNNCFSLFYSHEYIKLDLEEAYSLIWKRKEYINAYDDFFATQKNLHLIIDNNFGNHKNHLIGEFKQIQHNIEDLKLTHFNSIKAIKAYRRTPPSEMKCEDIVYIQNPINKAFPLPIPLWIDLSDDESECFRNHSLYELRRNFKNIKNTLSYSFKDSQK